MVSMSNQLALHTSTLDTTPLAEALRVTRDTGWDAVELRRVDFDRAEAAGQSEPDVLELVRHSQLAVSAVGVTAGWMFAVGDERAHLLDRFTRRCFAASALDCPIVMSAVDRARGDLRKAADSVRQVGDLATQYGVRIALEFNSQAAQFNSLDAVRELLALADHSGCGLLLDTYHLQRTGRGGRGFTEVTPQELTYFQYSDVPREGLQPGVTNDRLPPGEGVVDWAAVFGLLAEKCYGGPLSYEAVNSVAWTRDPAAVARQGLLATRAALSQ